MNINVPTCDLRQCVSVDQSDRHVPINLRQSGPTPVGLLISTRVRKSPYWHLSMEAGCWRATVYNRVYHPRGYVRPEHGGAMVEYDALVNHVTLWNVAVERQIQVKGPDAEAFVNHVITRNAARIEPMHAKYVILCNEDGGVLNDPVLLRVAEDEFWFSLADSDLELWLRGVNLGLECSVSIAEIDVAPVQIQGPKSEALMVDLFGERVRDIPYYGLMEGQVNGRDVIVSQTGFTGEKGYEIYLKDATLYAEDLWYGVLQAGERHQLMVTAPAHHRRIAAGILSWGQDLDQETLPFQCNLGYQVPRRKQADYVGKAALEAARRAIEAGAPPFRNVLVGMVFAGRPVTDYANDFWLIGGADGGDPVGYVTSPWFSPELETNIALGYVPWEMRAIGTRLLVHLPDQYSDRAGQATPAEVVDVPFRPSVNPNARERAPKTAAATASTDPMRASTDSFATAREADVLYTLRTLAREASVELSPRQLASIGSLPDHLPGGTAVYVPFVPGATWTETTAACRRLRGEGMSPVPHLPARWLASPSQLDDWLGELAATGVREIMLVAGDRARPAGPYRDTLDVLDSGKLLAGGFRRVGITGYPEGHPAVSEADLDAALTRKLEYAAATGTDLWITTQFTFASAHTIAWLDRMRERDCAVPIRVGLPGPARLRTLLAFAARCGVTASARMLTRRPSVVHLLKRWTPDPLVRELAEHGHAVAGRGFAGIHVFTFGGLPATARWLRGLRADGPKRHARTRAAEGPVLTLHGTQADDPNAGTPLRPVIRLAQERLGVPADQLTPYGHHKAKLSLDVLRPLRPAQGKLVLVTAVSPTPAGEGKTTTSIGLTDA